MKILVFENCSDCIYIRKKTTNRGWGVRCDDQVDTGKRLCKLSKYKDIENVSIIPNWCRLPDLKPITPNEQDGTA